MKNKGFSLIVIPVFVAVVIVVGYIFTKQKPTSITPIVNPSPVSEIKGWKTYRNDLYSYTMRIPETWVQIEHSSNFQNTETFEAPDQSRLTIRVESNKYKTLEEYLKYSDKTDETGFEGKPSKIVSETQNKAIGPYLGIERKENWIAAGFTTWVNYLAANNKVYIFSIITSAKSSEIANSQVFKDYYQVLSSFRLNSSNSVPTCKPRPACLDLIPACKMPESLDMCPPKEKNFF